MSPRELALTPLNGLVTTLAFTESVLTVRSGLPADDTPKQRSFCFASTSTTSSLSEIPVYNVIAATVCGSTVKVSYVKRSRNHRLCLQHVQGNVPDSDVALATEWCSSIVQVAYEGANPAKVLRVLINPHGGPGKARQIFEEHVEPILLAAGCTLDVTLTTRAGHAMEIVQHMPLTYDALVVISGDGLVHEVMNGLAKHAASDKAFCVPIAPIPAGSGNGLSLNILGLRDGLDPCAATLNVLKGQPMKVDLFSFKQGTQKRISFMSQTVGLMADLDIETEHLRWMGDVRFIWGYLRGVALRKICNMEFSMKVVEQDKSQMVDALHARRRSAAKGLPPVLPPPDISPRDDKQVDEMDSEGTWVTFDKPMLYMFAGKGPYVSRSLMQFPVSHPDDGLIDISIQEIVSRRFLLDAMKSAEIGRTYWFNSNQYFKVSAYRAKPLTANGVLMVDGESFPFEEFEVEVLPRMGTLLSPHPYYAADFRVIDSKGTLRETM